MAPPRTPRSRRDQRDPSPRARPAQAAFTLIEMTIVMVILAVVAALVAQALTQAATAYNQVSASLAAQAQLRYALDRIAREVRQVGTDATTPRAYSITTPAAPTAASKTLVFTRNDGTTVTIDGNSTTQVTMAYSSPAATGRLADVVSPTSTALSINFYNRATAGNVAATSYSVWNLGAIEFTLTVTASGESATATTRVALRAVQ